MVIVDRGKPPPQSALEAVGLNPARLVLCHVRTPDISASELRRAIAAGESVAGKVPAAVERYIAAHHIYGDNRRVGS
jgi:nicotinic acid mononucleotide adenylyltransferase